MYVLMSAIVSKSSYNVKLEENIVIINAKHRLDVLKSILPYYVCK